MAELVKCAYCGEGVKLPGVERGGKVYCCEGCAYEAQRLSDCGGRSDSITAPQIVEPEKRTIPKK